MAWTKKKRGSIQYNSSWRWAALATYNAECSRGIIHTPEYQARMAREQALFDAEAWGISEPTEGR